MVDPLTIFAIDEVTIQSKLDVVTVLAAESDIERAIQEEYGAALSVISGYLDDVGFQDVSARHRTHYYPPPETDTSNLLEILLGDPA